MERPVDGRARCQLRRTVVVSMSDQAQPDHLEFKIYKAQIDAPLIDAVLNKLEKFKNGNLAVFRAQGTDRFEYPRLDEFGNQTNSIHNPHLHGFHIGFANAVRQIIFSEKVSDCLKDFTGHTQHVHFQSMLFDKSTGTKLHQDTWYLDTSPPGRVVGVWFALEDITEEAGAFYLYENSPKEKVSPDNFDFAGPDQCAACEAQNPQLRRFDFLPKKGDILIWNSFVLHGAHQPKDPSKTRKSLTSHYYPHGAQVQDAPIKRLISIYDHVRPKPTGNPDILQATKMNPLIYSSMCLMLHAAGKFGVASPRRDAEVAKTTEIRRL